MAKKPVARQSHAVLPKGFVGESKIWVWAIVAIISAFIWIILLIYNQGTTFMGYLFFGLTVFGIAVVLACFYCGNKCQSTSPRLNPR